METTTSTTKSVLNDLVLINNDRIAGYEKALEELKSDEHAENLDLSSLFQSMIDQSRQFRNELGTEVQVLGEDMEEGTMVSGKLYRAWMDVKAMFTGNDRHTILSSCEGGEDAAQKAYQLLFDTTLRTLVLRREKSPARFPWGRFHSAASDSRSGLK